MAADLTAERLRELLDYNPETGAFVWRVTRGPAKAGAPAGGLNTRGYHQITVDVHNHRAHRLAWLYVYGRWPKGEIDHINGVCDDNRIVNLREATHAENMQNVALQSNNTSGYAGVNWRFGSWHASIRHHGRKVHLGRYPTPEAAYAAYLAAKAELHTFQPVPRDLAVAS